MHSAIITRERKGQKGRQNERERQQQTERQTDRHREMNRDKRGGIRTPKTKTKKNSRIVALGPF